MGPHGTRLLAAVLVLGLCALAGAKKPWKILGVRETSKRGLPPGKAACQCSRMNPQNRKNCGFPGITSEQCFAAGCCFDSRVPAVPWCFNPLPQQGPEECVMEVSERRDCGYPGISAQECAARKCCFSDRIPEVPWCFFPRPVQDCHY